VSLSRYEEIFLRLAAAEVAAGKSWISAMQAATGSIEYYAAAATKIEEHFKARDLKQLEILSDTPALLKRQAE